MRLVVDDTFNRIQKLILSRTVSHVSEKDLGRIQSPADLLMLKEAEMPRG